MHFNDSLMIGLLSLIVTLLPLRVTSVHLGRGLGYGEEDQSLNLVSGTRPGLLSDTQDPVVNTKRSNSDNNNMNGNSRHTRAVEQQPGQSQVLDGGEENFSLDDEPQLKSSSSNELWKLFKPVSLPPESKYGTGRWYFPGLGYFSRGGRADSNFIRFGRNSVGLGPSFQQQYQPPGPITSTKKNNFIRLGRENPRQNNFIRLGRSGLWDSNERFGSKIGFFPDYYSASSAVSPNSWSKSELNYDQSPSSYEAARQG